MPTLNNWGTVCYYYYDDAVCGRAYDDACTLNHRRDSAHCCRCRCCPSPSRRRRCDDRPYYDGHGLVLLDFVCVAYLE